MLRYEPYFFKNGVAIVAVNRDPTRKLPEPWPFLLDTRCEYIESHWIRFFTDFLVVKREDPSNFELHYPDGYIQRISWDPDRKRWSKKFDRQTMPFLDLWDIKIAEGV